jgi:hypothetical protein
VLVGFAVPSVVQFTAQHNRAAATWDEPFCSSAFLQQSIMPDSLPSECMGIPAITPLPNVKTKTKDASRFVIVSTNSIEPGRSLSTARAHPPGNPPGTDLIVGTSLGALSRADGCVNNHQNDFSKRKYCSWHRDSDHAQKSSLTDAAQMNNSILDERAHRQRESLSSSVRPR